MVRGYEMKCMVRGWPYAVISDRIIPCDLYVDVMLSSM
jgi:hypothetical protein